MLRPAAIAATALLLGAPAYAQDRIADIDKIFSFATPDAPGCAVGVSQNGKVVATRAYGLADFERGVPMSTRTIFDIGSTQKQFVAAAILLLAEDGRLSLSDDIRKHVPELPDYGQTITIDHLLSHTSGIRDWIGLSNFSSEEEEALTMILRQRGLNFAPGEEWSYSNSGYVLLKEIVARKSGTSFAEFARKRIFEPIGMKSTSYVADILQGTGERALAYEKEGTGWRQHMRLGINRGGGAMISNAGDLLLWNDALTSGRLGRFVTEKLQEQATLNNGRKLTYARGLMVNVIPHGRMVSHSGGAAGYSTWLGRFTDHGLSVAVLCNFEPVSATSLAGRVADLFLPPVDPQSQPPGPVAAEGVEVDGRGGLYLDVRTGDPLRLNVNGGRLAIAGGPPLVPVSENRFRPRRATLFFRSEDDYELTFRSNDELELKSMEGQTTRYRRAQPYTPTAAELHAFAGRYESEELKSVFEVAPAAGGVTIRLNGDRTLEFTPIGPGTFDRNLMTVRFRQDGNGKVVGLEYGNPMLRKVTFTRTGDAAAAPPTPAQRPAAPTATPTAPEASTSTSAAPRLEALTGEYELAPGRVIGITLEGGRLYGQPPGGEKRALEHVSGTTYSAAGTPITLTFTLGADGRATAVVMRQNGRERTLPRVR